MSLPAEPASAPRPLGDSPVGVGLGLRWDFLDDLLERLDDPDRRAELEGVVPFWEVSPENYMRRGGYIPESLERVADRFPIVTHGLQMSIGGMDPFEERYFAPLRRFIERFATPWHSDHLCFCGTDGRILHDLLPMPQTEAAALHCAARVAEARDRLEIPMAVENISFYLLMGHPDLAEAAFVNRVLEEADCGLLLDVNNVYVNSLNHGFDPVAWIDAIDPSRVWQIHVAGHDFRAEDGLTIDTHGSAVVEPVIDLLEHTIARVGPVAVILERDNDVPPLDMLLTERARLDEAYRRGLARHRSVNAPEETG